MTTFTIAADNNVTAYSNADMADRAGDSAATTFDSPARLAQISSGWPLSRFVDLWNSIPGQTPVKKFQDRQRAVARVWAAIQSLAGTAAASEPRQPEPLPKGSENAQHATLSPKRAVASTQPRTAGPAQTNGGERRHKKATVTALMQREQGVTLAEIQDATGWQAHTVRGFVSLLGSQGGLTIESSRNGTGERTYKADN